MAVSNLLLFDVLYKIMNTVINNIDSGLRNADFVWQSVPIHP